jgi:peptide-methionine (R)-S-oxide reductase
MMSKRRFLLGGLAALGMVAVARRRGGTPTAEAAQDAPFEVVRSEEEWRRLLTPAQFRVLREHDTERAGSNPLNQEHRAGTYVCAGCDLPLFSSETKFDSGTGWPSFWAPLPGSIGTAEDRRLFLTRTEVHCRRCGGHLGHVFEDGPPPTGLRYCLNGVALTFVPA